MKRNREKNLAEGKAASPGNLRKALRMALVSFGGVGSGKNRECAFHSIVTNVRTYDNRQDFFFLRKVLTPTVHSSIIETCSI